MINITFRRANQPTGGEIPFEFIPVVRISGFTILPARKVRECASLPAGVKNREAFERRAMTSLDDLRSKGYMPREIHLTRHNTIRPATMPIIHANIARYDKYSPLNVPVYLSYTIEIHETKSD